jgi:hypothetical protein
MTLIDMTLEQRIACIVSDMRINRYAPNFKNFFEQGEKYKEEKINWLNDYVKYAYDYQCNVMVRVKKDGRWVIEILKGPFKGTRIFKDFDSVANAFNIPPYVLQMPKYVLQQ